MEEAKGLRITWDALFKLFIAFGVLVMLGIYGWGWAENNLIVKSRLAQQVQELQQKLGVAEKDLATERAKTAKVELSPAASVKK